MTTTATPPTMAARASPAAIHGGALLESPDVVLVVVVDGIDGCSVSSGATVLAGLVFGVARVAEDVVVEVLVVGGVVVGWASVMVSVRARLAVGERALSRMAQAPEVG